MPVKDNHYKQSTCTWCNLEVIDAAFFSITLYVLLVCLKVIFKIMAVLAAYKYWVCWSVDLHLMTSFSIQCHNFFLRLYLQVIFANLIFFCFESFQGFTASTDAHYCAYVHMQHNKHKNRFNNLLETCAHTHTTHRRPKTSVLFCLMLHSKALLSISDVILGVAVRWLSANCVFGNIELFKIDPFHKSPKVWIYRHLNFLPHD